MKIFYYQKLFNNLIYESRKEKGLLRFQTSKGICMSINIKDIIVHFK